MTYIVGWHFPKKNQGNINKIIVEFHFLPKKCSCHFLKCQMVFMGKYLGTNLDDYIVGKIAKKEKMFLKF